MNDLLIKQLKEILKKVKIPRDASGFERARLTEIQKNIQLVIDGRIREIQIYEKRRVAEFKKKGRFVVIKEICTLPTKEVFEICLASLVELFFRKDFKASDLHKILQYLAEYVNPGSLFPPGKKSSRN